MMQRSHPELDCLCGAREPDTGQPVPIRCWNCGSNTMGQFTRRDRGKV